MKIVVHFLLFGMLACTTCSRIVAAEPVTLENVVAPEANRADEPMAKKFSLASATEFLDSASLNWQKKRKCFACHTNYAYLQVRPLLSRDAPAHRAVRAFAEELITVRWKEEGPRWEAEVVSTAAALAFNDAATTGSLHPLTKTALDRMWTLQRDDGGWKWLKCKWPPMESDDHYGVTLAALAVGVAPGEYARTAQAKQGLAGIRKYLKANPGTTLHHRAMTLWASTKVTGLLTTAEQKKIVDELLALQKPDGGWGLATLGDWKRDDGSSQDTASSDGYGTGFVIYVLRQAGLPASDARLQKGVAWIKTHQRESGRWFTRSLKKDGKHYITNAGSAYAVLALIACDAVEPGVGK